MQDGIATDTETSLMWLCFAHGQTWQNGTAVGEAKQVDWQMAFYEARNCNRQGGYAGFTDWRLPTVDELKTLIAKVNGIQWNRIDADVFPNNKSKSKWFWSSLPYSDYSSDAWVVGFDSVSVTVASSIRVEALLFDSCVENSAAQWLRDVASVFCSYAVRLVRIG